MSSLTTPVQHNTGVLLASKMRKEEEILLQSTELEIDIKWSLFADDKVIYVDNYKEGLKKSVTNKQV